MVVTEASTNSNEFGPYVTPDGLELWFFRAGQLFVSARLTPATAWMAPAPSGIGANGSPSMTEDMLDLYYVETCPAPGSGPCVLRRHRATTNDPWGDPTVVTIPMDLQYNSAHVSRDGRGILLSGPFSATTMRVAQAWKANRDDEWTEVTAIDSLSSDTSIEHARWSLVGTEIYLVGAGGIGGKDILVSRCQ